MEVCSEVGEAFVGLSLVIEVSEEPESGVEEPVTCLAGGVGGVELCWVCSFVFAGEVYGELL